MSSSDLQTFKRGGFKGQYEIQYSRPEAYATPPDYVEFHQAPITIGQSFSTIIWNTTKGFG
jgi:hypothetical protein